MALFGYGRVSTDGQSLTAAPSGRSCCQYALHDGSPDSESPANPQDAHALGPSSCMRASTEDLTGRRPSLMPRSLAPGKARIDPLADHAALEFSKDPAHLKHRPARWRAGV